MYGSTDPAGAGYGYSPGTPGATPQASHGPDRASRPPRPRAGWRQAGSDLLYLLPGLPIAIASFTLMVTGFWLGVGLIPLALVGLVVLLVTLMTARGFAAAERSRVSLLEGRRVGPAYYRHPEESGFSRILGYLRDPQLWRDFFHGIIILPVRVFTWSFTIAWTAASLMITYPLWAWSLPHDDDEQRGLADLVLGWDSFAADVTVNTVIGVVFAITLPYIVRGLAAIESALAWTILTNENAALRARADELTRSRQAVVQAEADTLRKVERDIHDGPQQRLVRLTMDLQSAQRRLDDDPEAAAPLVKGALQQTQEALAELRALSRGIAPPILTDRGLAAALAAAAARCPVPTTLDIQLDADERLPTAVENAAYFVVTESLTNVAKHSGATSCEVSVFTAGDLLCIRVADNGRGGAHIGKGHGLAGLADRLAGVDGELSLDSPYSAGTVVNADIPVR
ncbi:sensor histidine kinase [Phytoactinopolyspora mesophila]|uniref:histidine kinase n=1 Tax=Phytoactinopolyspora mesophila TaxID=2650750 RepID=A0A7K3M788_9ACTN|nr:sensor histidine kinase [Phytoactinopolyspora mesophila]NDL59145.1 sensor histidine kinase [Phytoactinopolyspora mesophila]